MKLDPHDRREDRQDLAAALRALRKELGLTGASLAVRCAMSQSKISRIETSRIVPTIDDVELILDALGVEGSLRADLLQLASAANTEYEDVRESVRRGLHHRQRELAALENSAGRIRFFLPAMLTGLLQTPEYMRAAMNPDVDTSTVDVTRAVALKLSRQSILYDDTKRFEFLITESAARWPIVPTSAMAVQLDRLASLTRLSSVRLGVIPVGARVSDPPMSTFTVYDEKLVTIEMFTGRIVLRDPKDIQHYHALFDYFSARAEYGDAARARLSEWSEDIRS